MIAELSNARRAVAGHFEVTRLGLDVTGPWCPICDNIANLASRPLRSLSMAKSALDARYTIGGQGTGADRGRLKCSALGGSGAITARALRPVRLRLTDNGVPVQLNSDSRPVSGTGDKTDLCGTLLAIENDDLVIDVAGSSAPQLVPLNDIQVLGAGDCS